MKRIPLQLLVGLSLLIAAGFLLHRAYPDSSPARAFDRGLGALKQAVSSHSGSTELHKCVSASRTEYSSGKCPPGGREMPLEGGAVTVVPGAPVAAPAASAASSMPTARDLLVKPEEPSLMDKRIERAVGN